ncbi:hypothetical protein SAMN05421641_11364 [Paracoccus thiocyanatus]|uniref:Uncharacterized protein n=1 Tax=Paracoccus thiocyanatus TaxID=34006 RepID=A0A1N6VC31_9RHOB|nr:hypothetical protein SAMN05421641_11364 [Paracoccus thiocyanatus]
MIVSHRHRYVFGRGRRVIIPGCAVRGLRIPGAAGQGDDLPQLETRLGFPLHPLPHENRSDHGDWRAAYDAETAGIVARAAAEDIARFGYRFDPD